MRAVRTDSFVVVVVVLSLIACQAAWQACSSSRRSSFQSSCQLCADPSEARQEGSTQHRSKSSAGDADARPMMAPSLSHVSLCPTILCVLHRPPLRLPRRRQRRTTTMTASWPA